MPACAYTYANNSRWEMNTYIHLHKNVPSSKLKLGDSLDQQKNGSRWWYSHTMQDSAQKQQKTELLLLLHANNVDEKEVRTK